MRGRTVALKVRYEDFSTVSRSMTLATPTDLAGVIHSTATTMLDRLGRGHRVRLVGVRLEGLVPAGEVSEQLELGGGDDEGPGWREAEGALDLVIARFGPTAIRRAALFNRPKGDPGRSKADTGPGSSLRDHPKSSKMSDSASDSAGR